MFLCFVFFCHRMKIQFANVPEFFRPSYTIKLGLRTPWISTLKLNTKFQMWQEFFISQHPPALLFLLLPSHHLKEMPAFLFQVNQGFITKQNNSISWSSLENIPQRFIPHLIPWHTAFCAGYLLPLTIDFQSWFSLILLTHDHLVGSFCPSFFAQFLIFLPFLLYFLKPCK